MKKYLLTVLLMTGITYVSCDRKDDSFKTEIYQEIRSVNKMALASMSITKTAKLESSDWYTIGKRIAVYSYDSYMRAYIDLSELQPDDFIFDDDNMKVRVILPPVRTEITGRDMGMRKEYENIGLLRSELDSKERAEIKEKANASFKKEVENNPVFKKRLTDTAERKARAFFENLFASRGYHAEVVFGK